MGTCLWAAALQAAVAAAEGSVHLCRLLGHHPRNGSSWPAQHHRLRAKCCSGCQWPRAASHVEHLLSWWPAPAARPQRQHMVAWQRGMCCQRAPWMPLRAGPWTPLLLPAWVQVAAAGGWPSRLALTFWSAVLGLCVQAWSSLQQHASCSRCMCQ